MEALGEGEEARLCLAEQKAQSGKENVSVFKLRGMLNAWELILKETQTFLLPADLGHEWPARGPHSPELPALPCTGRSPGAALGPQLCSRLARLPVGRGGVPARGVPTLMKSACPVTRLGAPEDDQPGWEACTEPFPCGQAHRSHGTVCSHSLLPPPFLPRVQGRELARASGTWFCSPKAGTEDGA